MGKILLVVVAFAALVYGVFWLIERRRAKRSGARSAQPRSTPPPRTSSPDDDPDFLRELERRQRRAEREKAARDAEAELKAEEKRRHDHPPQSDDPRADGQPGTSHPDERRDTD